MARTRNKIPSGKSVNSGRTTKARTNESWNRIQRPGSKGMNTEIPSWELDEQESPYIQDVISTGGILTYRGSPSQMANSNFNSSATTSLYACSLPNQALMVPPHIIGTNLARNGGIYSAAGWQYIAAPSPAPSSIGLVREIFNGEAIVCWQDGISSINRFAASPSFSTGLNTLAASTGSIQTSTGISGVFTTDISGASTNFLSAAKAGSFLGFFDLKRPQRNYRVVITNSDGQLAVDCPLDIETSVGWNSSWWGYIGLQTVVANSGVASLTNASTSMTGLGTAWAGLAPLNGTVQNSDFVYSLDVSTAFTGYVSSVTNNNTIVLNNGWSGTTQTNGNYLITRQAVGTEARAHRGVFFCSGVAWAPNRLYYATFGSPGGFLANTLSNYWNGLYSQATDLGHASLMQYIPVPSDQAEGGIVALLSSPSPLLILRNDSCYGLFGDVPNQDIRIIADGAGCCDIRATCSNEYGQFWAGYEGIYWYASGRVVDITEGKRNREWRNLMVQIQQSGDVITHNNMATSVSMGFIDHYLLISVHNHINSVNISQTWVYDLQQKVWLGNFSGIDPQGYTTYNPKTFLSLATPQSMYFVPGDFQTVGVNENQTFYKDNGMMRSATSQGTGNYPGTFILDIPESSDGDFNATDLTRVIENKISYELSGGDGSTVISIQSAVDGGSLGQDYTLPTVTGQQEARSYPISDVTAPPAGALGLLGRRHATRITHTGTKPANLKIHEFDVLTRQRPDRT